jgi:hypothetical protein
MGKNLGSFFFRKMEKIRPQRKEKKTADNNLSIYLSNEVLLITDRTKKKKLQLLCL